MVRFVSNLYHGSHRCLCCHVRTGSIILTASYTVVWTVMAGFELVRLFRPDSKVDVSLIGLHFEGAFHRVDSFASLMLDIFLTAVSGLGVYGIIKYYTHFLTPFIIYLVVDFTIYCIEVLGIYVELPEYVHIKHYVQNVCFLINAVWNCFKFMKELEQESSLVDTLLDLRSRTRPPAYKDIMKLPLHEEVVKKAPELPFKEFPPSYTPM
ncbi:lysosomal-associated transmembrane protein 4A-like isoform X2 [Pristis pectinata]|uniref:lysosomal-associated transmembrane protein 4A-like isoform X2 n=1 Tax=Pristis pectinata TaxID=685728 RepID=UPI00223D464F|nr:lysosomal-associated transmembrane protein 4A-like isoform X2 [Pristis pectinata]